MVAKAHLSTEDISGINLETATLLEQWGRWAVKCPTRSLMFPSMEPYRCMYVMPGDTISMGVYVKDSILEACDRGLAKLAQRDAEMGKLTALYYLTGCNILRIERDTKVSRYRANELIKSGTAWMDCFLYGIEEHF